ncbi:hypothetical protein CIB95_09595 [Lottiidibacillus patelloidae]|uniref:Putative Flp pilus-assembly TadG-like N-terminal domain-containing protein n=1 Tax=Lottiidibacillus patelloidae TaxID=2670334 RepID=A0A263BTG4_9BACI|nr:Tad domain-containing protein [Lottiidibacillus patelloidae]OZM57013.1 hypothetical protein CIB95_09595 [Lottiidibacillus patelloidae]
MIWNGLKKNSKGQSTIIFAITLPIFFAAIALAIDLGWVTYHMSKAQDAADLAVLSGVQSLPLNPVEAENTTREVFIDNYGKGESIKNILVIKGTNSVKLDYVDEVKLFFLPIVGKDTIKIKGSAEAIIEPLAKPHTIIPMAMSNKTPFVIGEEILLFGQLIDPASGNFGIVDPTNDNSLSPNDFADLIAEDYKGEKGMPAAGDEIWTRTGELGLRVKEGLLRRMANGNYYIICPVVDFNVINGKSKVKILGYVRFKLSSVLSTSGRHVEIKGKFVEFIEPKGEGNGNAFDFGTRAIRLKK